VTHRIIAALCCGLLVVSALRADDTTQPSARSEKPDPANKGEMVWGLTDYLKGTTAQVRALLNGDVDRLTAQIADTRRNIAELQTDIAAEKKHGLEQARNSPQYKALTDEMNQADLARKTSDGQDKLDASARFNKARFARQKMEEDAAAVGSTYTDDLQNLANAQKEIVGHEAALKKAKEWRGHLVAAIRSTFALDIPMRPGKTGLIASIQVVAVADDAVIGQYDAAVANTGTDAGTAEGIKTEMVEFRTVTLMLHGAYPAAKIGKVLSLNRSFEVVKPVADPELGKVYALKPVDTDVDKLLDGMPTYEAARPATRPSR
jgi:hypothetical protein